MYLSQKMKKELLLINSMLMNYMMQFSFSSLKRFHLLLIKLLMKKSLMDLLWVLVTNLSNSVKKVATLQNANVRFYAMFMLVGMSCVFVYLYISLGL